MMTTHFKVNQIIENITFLTHSALQTPTMIQLGKPRIDATQNNKNHRRPRVQCRPAIDTRLFFQFHPPVSTTRYWKTSGRVQLTRGLILKVVEGYRIHKMEENPSGIVLRSGIVTCGRIEGRTQWKFWKMREKTSRPIRGDSARGSFPFFSPLLLPRFAHKPQLYL